jgi:hypothetical protein
MHSNRIYPSWDQIENLRSPLTDGELALAKYLDANLPRDDKWQPSDKGDDYEHLQSYNGWLIFVQPFLNGSRPDIIIFHPRVGVMIYEVKDWNLRHYIANEDGSLKVNDGAGSYPIKHPKSQVEHYKENIQTQLVPAIGEAVDSNRKNFGLIKTGVYCHKATTKDCQSILGVPIKEDNFKYFPFVGIDELRPDRLQTIVPDANRQQSHLWNRAWNLDLLFWLLPPFHSMEQGTMLTLRGNQAKIAEPMPGHHRVRGVAGGGKTQALAFRAGKLASMGMNVLIITFNITLWHYIRDMIRRAPFNFQWDQFTFTHFHGFCKDRLNQCSNKWPKGPREDEFLDENAFQVALENFFRYTVPAAVKAAIQNHNIDVYDAILIDEGQDYYFQWYELLYSSFLNERDEVVVVCDKKQNIYQRELNWLDKRVTRVGLEKFESDYIDLTTSYRMPIRVAELSNQFSEAFNLNQEIRLSKIERLQNIAEHIVWRNINSTEWCTGVYDAYRRLTFAGAHPSDIVMLLPTHKIGLECVNFFKNQKIEVNHVFESSDGHKTNKKIFWMGDSRLKMCTIHSFKGWELLNIVVYIPPATKDSLSQMDAIVYTAITRTRANLIILNANTRYAEFGEDFPHTWEDQGGDKPFQTTIFL